MRRSTDVAVDADDRAGTRQRRRRAHHRSALRRRAASARAPTRGSDTDPLDTFAIGFASAAAVAAFSALIANYLAVRRERDARLAERRQRIYMKLLGIAQEHFWISSGDMQMPDRDIPKEVKDRYWSAAFDIIDELHAADELEQAPAIVDALIGLDFEHEWQRAEAISRVIKDLGRDVTPRVGRALKARDQRASAVMRRDPDEWWRRRGKIEPIVPSPKGRERARRPPESDEDAGDDGGSSRTPDD